MNNNFLTNVKDFIVDYCQRHAHPVNALLHIVGVPAAFFGFYKFFTGNFAYGLSLIFLGYLFQYLGHKAQGNEVGEVTLIKKCYKALKNKNSNKTDPTSINT